MSQADTISAVCQAFSPSVSHSTFCHDLFCLVHAGEDASCATAQEQTAYLREQWRHHQADLGVRQHTDLLLVPADGEGVELHSAIVLPQSPDLNSLLSTSGDQVPYIILSQVNRVTVMLMVDLIYTGECLVSLDQVYKLNHLLNSLGLTQMLKNCNLNTSYDCVKNEESPTSTNIASDGEAFDNDEVVFIETIMKSDKYFFAHAQDDLGELKSEMKCEEPPSDTNDILGLNISTGKPVRTVKPGGGRRRNRLYTQLLKNHCNTRGLDFVNNGLLTEHFKSVSNTKPNNLHMSPSQFQDNALTSIKVKSYNASDRIIRRKKAVIVTNNSLLLIDCDVCGHAFNSNKGLKIHKRVHRELVENSVKPAVKVLEKMLKRPCKMTITDIYNSKLECQSNVKKMTVQSQRQLAAQNDQDRPGIRKRMNSVYAVDCYKKARLAREIFITEADGCLEKVRDPEGAKHHKQSVSESNSPFKTTYSPKPLSSRAVLHSLNNIPWAVGEEEYSEEDMSWVKVKAVKDLMEFTDLTGNEKQFYCLWNKFLLDYSPGVGRVHLSSVLEEFVELWGKELRAKGLYRQFVAHLVIMERKGIIGQVTLLGIGKRLQECWKDALIEACVV